MIIKMTIKRMKKHTVGLWSVMVAIVLCLSLSACGKAPMTENGQEENLSVNESDRRTTAQIENLCVPLPENYDASTTEGLYLNSNYPQDQSNIYLYTGRKENDFLVQMQNGQQAFVDHLAGAYSEQYGMTPEISVLQYVQTTVAGYDAFVIELIYMLEETPYHQLEYIIDAEKTYYVAFSQVGAYSWMDAFRECATGIDFVNAE